MIKTHSKSRFQLKTLEEIRDSAEIVLQIEKTDSSFIDSKKTAYLCEVVNPRDYRATPMLDKVKLALRLSGTALDGEVSDLINAAIADLRLVGINIPAEAGSSSKTLGDPLLDRAVVLYAKAEFGFNDDAERYRNAYDYLKCALSLTADYTEESEGK